MTGKDRYLAFLRKLPDPGTTEQHSARYPLSATEPVILGRDPSCQIVLDPLLYRLVSRQHAAINALADAELWQVCDLNSSNGTFLNGQRLQRCQNLQAGDRIMLGQDGPEFIFEYVPTPVSPPITKAVSLPTVPPPRQNRTPTAPPKPHKTEPRSDLDSISLTQLFPIFSTGRELARKAYLLPAGITVTFVVLMFLAVGQPVLFNLLLAAYLSGGAYYFVYQLCGKHKPWWVLVLAGLLTILLLLRPILSLFIFVFRYVLPGDFSTDDASISFPVLLIKMFFGAGLMEELLKALPIFAIYWLGRQMRQSWRDQVGVWEPLDGILLGAASAVGFTLIETLGQYIPEIYQTTLGASGENAAQLASLQLLIPRVLGSVAGHIAYSGYLGYFIGLSVLRPRKRWLILGVGYLTASSLHALWNAAGLLNPILLAVVGVLSYAFLGAAILKARELSPTRSQNFATRFYQ